MSRPWTATVVTIFPEMFPGPLGLSLAGRALTGDLWRLDPVDLRGFATDRHRTVDDTPFGGGAGNTKVCRPASMGGGGNVMARSTSRGCICTWCCSRSRKPENSCSPVWRLHLAKVPWSKQFAMRRLTISRQSRRFRRLRRALRLPERRMSPPAAAVAAPPHPRPAVVWLGPRLSNRITFWPKSNRIKTRSPRTSRV